MSRHRTRRIKLDRVKKTVTKCSRELLPGASVVSIALLDDAEMSEINEEYTGRKGSTDVLSFPLGISKHDKRWYGEILVSLDRAYRQAKQKDVTLLQEVIRLLVHAVVHLSGHDHYDKKGFKEMRRREVGLLFDCIYS